MKFSCKPFRTSLLAILWILFFSIQTFYGIIPALAQDTKGMVTTTTDHTQKNENKLHKNNGVKHSNYETTDIGVDPKMELNPDYILGRYIIPGLIFLAGVAGIFLWVIVAARRKRTK
jgi:hypothetical protein